MTKRWMIAMAGFGLLLSVGCPKSPEGPARTSEPEPGQVDVTDRPELTNAECQARGGTIVGDIGDGSTRRPDYRCANGQPPIGNIRAEQGEPIAIEGAVCCPTGP